MIRRPPRSTLFPYTTLFRSGRGKFRLFDCATNNFKRLVSACAGPDGGPDSFGDLGKLFASGGTIDVGRKHKRGSEEHTAELQSQSNIVCRLLPEKKKTLHLH